MSVLPILATAFGGVALLIGLIFLIPYRYVRDHFDRSVTGKVVELTENAAKFNREQGHEEARLGGDRSPIRVKVSVGGRSRSVVNGGYRTANMYHKVYTYTVGNETFTRADGVRYSQGLAQKWVGREVPVYYDSANPSQASLSQGRGYRLVSGILIPIGIALLALAAWLWMQFA